MDAKTYFDNLRNTWTNKEPSVQLGKMMHAEALKVDDNVFAFLSKHEELVVKLPNYLDHSDLPVLTAFNPFKYKGPLKGWWGSSFEDHHQWEALLSLAFENVKNNNQ